MTDLLFQHGDGMVNRAIGKYGPRYQEPLPLRGRSDQVAGLKSCRVCNAHHRHTPWGHGVNLRTSLDCCLQSNLQGGVAGRPVLVGRTSISEDAAVMPTT